MGGALFFNGVFLKRIRSSPYGRLMTSLVLLLAAGGLILILLSMSLWITTGGRLLRISLHSPFAADYSADPRILVMVPVQTGLVGDFFQDNPTQFAGLPTVVSGLLTPIPTITPFLPPGQTSTPLVLVPTSTSIPATTEPSPPTATWTFEPTWTFQPTLTPTRTLTPPPGSTPTLGPTQPPTALPTPTRTATATVRPTFTWTPTWTATVTPTPKPTHTNTSTPTPTPTATWGYP